MMIKILLFLEYSANTVEFMSLTHFWLWHDTSIYLKPYKTVEFNRIMIILFSKEAYRNF